MRVAAVFAAIVLVSSAAFAQGIPIPTTQMVLSLVCAPGDIEFDLGWKCRNAIGFPKDQYDGDDACEISIADDQHFADSVERGRFLPGHRIVLVGYETNCAPGVLGGSGVLAFEYVADKLRLSSYTRSLSLGDCVQYREGNRERLFCLDVDYSHGTVIGMVNEIIFSLSDDGKVHLDTDNVIYAHDTAATDYLPFTDCPSDLDLWDIGSMTLGSRGTLILHDVIYLDAASNAAACERDPPLKNEFGDGPIYGDGTVYLDDADFKRGTFAYDIKTRELTLQSETSPGGRKQ